MSLAEDLRAAHLARRDKFFPKHKPVAWSPPPLVPQAIDAGYSGMWFWDLITGHSKPQSNVMIADIQRACCKYFRITMNDLLSGRRTSELVRPRHVAMYLCKTMTLHSFSEIGRKFKRDHTTVIHASERIAGLYGSDLQVTCDVNAIRKVLA